MDSHWPHDSIVEELEGLFETGATREALAACQVLISMLPPEVVASEASRASKARALEHVLQEAIKKRSQGTDKTAEHVRAAHELLGWTTRSSDEIRELLAESYEFSSKKLGELKTVDLTSLGARSVLAGARFSKPLTSQRSVRARRPEIARHLADAVQDVVEDKTALRESDAQFHESTRLENQQPHNETLILNDKPGRAGHRLTRQSALVAAVLAGGVVIGTIAIALISQRPSAVETSNPDGAQAPQATLTAPAPFARMAEVRYTEGKGLNTFLGPGNMYPRGNPPHLAERQVITIVCQERNGQAIHDPLGDPNRYTEPWPVWDKLSNGLWVSDLYINLPKIPGETPPDGIPRC